MKIFIDRIGPWSDKGMAAITVSMAKILREAFSTVTISVSGPMPQDIDVVKYREYGLEIKTGMFSGLHLATRKYKPLKPKALKAIMLGAILFISLLRYSLWLFLWKTMRFDAKFLVNDARDTIQSYKEADWIIFGGGQHIMNISPGLITILYEISFARILGKPVMLYAQSFGPFNPKYARRPIKFVLDKADLITTRENMSAKWLINDVGVESPVITTADAAFMLPSIPREKALNLLQAEAAALGDGLMVGVTAVRNLPDYKDAEVTYAKYIQVLAEAVDHIIINMDAHVFIFPQVIYVPGKDDRVASKELFERIHNQSRVTVLTKDYSPEQLKGMYGCMNLFVGTRFHSCIFAQSMHVPTVPIEYHGHKGLGIMQMLNLDKYVNYMKTINTPELTATIDTIWAEREEVHQKLVEQIEIMQGKSLENIHLAVEYLGLPENSGTEQR